MTATLKIWFVIMMQNKLEYSYSWVYHEDIRFC